MHQYVQHDWSPAMWAGMLMILATLVVLGMGLFLVAAQRPKVDHGAGAAPEDAPTARS